MSASRAQQIRLRNERRASLMKEMGEERTTGRCAVCYAIIPCDGPKSRYRHVCAGVA